jgi:hypothetical protein
VVYRHRRAQWCSSRGVPPGLGVSEATFGDLDLTMVTAACPSSKTCHGICRLSDGCAGRGVRGRHGDRQPLGERPASPMPAQLGDSTACRSGPETRSSSPSAASSTARDHVDRASYRWFGAHGRRARRRGDWIEAPLMTPLGRPARQSVVWPRRVRAPALTAHSRQRQPPSHRSSALASLLQSNRPRAHGVRHVLQRDRDCPHNYVA